ncbi:hypothetical protein HWD35_21465 [Tsukamurella tyrosinosolvens]|uniref:hypothetical protein n=1 Tax=Tsukamurella tyrosinosolvens TaxID=57704 RepID=UPI001CE1E5DD|nr:hypothetical protein [Tsukamurella tyrosinosolvens]MCA4997296.1 hypothetical protein [Tsukamurella tyrosinosolvens]
MNSSIEPGAEQIYRLHDFSPSERVRVVAIDRRKKTPRYEVEFLDGEKAGVVENVPGVRLRGDWVNVGDYDARMTYWERFVAEGIDRAEDSAVTRVFEELVPGEIARLDWSRSTTTVTVIDATRLAELIGLPGEDVLDGLDYFLDDEGAVVSPAGTMRIAEAVCRAHPMPILDWVMADEKMRQAECTQGRRITTTSGKDININPEHSYRLYIEYDRPVHEMLRAWCGHRAVSLQQQIDAAEAEVRRLNELLTRVIDQLKSHEHSIVAEIIEREQFEGRITPANVRPVVNRPLKPSEMPHREVPARRGRRWW